MSLDGFIAGPNDEHGNGLGDDGWPLHEWIESGDPQGAAFLQEMIEGLGVLMMGRHGYEVVDWGPTAYFNRPVYVLTHHPPEENPVVRGDTFHFIDDGLEAAIARAKEEAGDGVVALHGASLVQQALRAGLLDEIIIHLVPILLGDGKRLFASPIDQVRLDPIRVLDTPRATHLHYRVV